MKSIEILALAIRIIGIYGCFKVIEMIATFYFMTGSWLYEPFFDGLWIWIVGAIFCGVLFLSACIALLIFPVAVARKLLPKTEDNEPLFSGNSDDLSVIAFTVIGVYLLSVAVPELFYHIVSFVYLNWGNEAKVYDAGVLDARIIQLVAALLKIGIGIYLCLQAKGLNTLILKLRGRA